MGKMRNLITGCNTIIALLLVVFALAVSACGGQGRAVQTIPQITPTPIPGGWIHTWGGVYADEAKALAVDPEGNVFVVGSERSFGREGYAAFLLKYASNGTLLWQKSLFYREAFVEEVVLDGSGNIYLAGTSFQRTFLLKYSSVGTLLWQKEWKTAGGSRAKGAVADGSGNVYVAGYTSVSSEADDDAFLLKYASDGTLLWQKIWDGGDDDWIFALAIDGLGDLVLAGFTKRIINGSSSGDPLLTGSTKSINVGNGDVLVLKYSSDGAPLWQRTWGGSGYESAQSAKIDNDGNVFIAGITQSFGEGMSDAFILKYASDGTLEWQRTWGSNSNEHAYCLALDNIGDPYLTGECIRGNMGWQSFIIKYSSEGTLQWQKVWKDSMQCEAYALALDGNGLLYIAGGSFSPNGSWENPDYVTSSPDGVIGNPTGSSGDVIGDAGVPGVNEATLHGIEDGCAGSFDAFVMKIDPSGW
jgi:uncharacterized delta-60 repeat protein